MQIVYLVVGCPGSGKSWVCEQLTELFEYVHHDLYIKMTGSAYVDAILEAADHSTRPILAEAPFSISKTMEPLEEAGCTVVPVFIVEDPEVISDRYLAREGKNIPPGHLTRQRTYAERAAEYNAFTGTSDEVLVHLKSLCTPQVRSRKKSA